MVRWCLHMGIQVVVSRHGQGPIWRHPRIPVWNKWRIISVKDPSTSIMRVEKCATISWDLFFFALSVTTFLWWSKRPRWARWRLRYFLLCRQFGFRTSCSVVPKTDIAHLIEKKKFEVPHLIRNSAACILCLKKCFTNSLRSYFFSNVGDCPTMSPDWKFLHIKINNPILRGQY